MAITPEIFGLSRILAPLFGGMQEEEEYNPMQRMNQLYSPENFATGRLNQHIDAMPVRQPPGMLRKIVASVAGLQGPSAAPQQEQIMYGDFGRQLADWESKLNPLVQSANFERQGNINERMLANQIVSNEQRDRTLERQTRRDRVLEEQGNRRIDQADRRIAQADERVKIAQAVAKGGTIDWGSNQIVYRDGTTAPINADLFTTQEKMALQQEYALERIQANAVNRPGNRDRLRTEVIDDPDNPGRKILVTINLDTNEVTRATMAKPGGERTTVTPTTRTEESQANRDRKITAEALRIRAQDPKLGRYIKIKGGRFEGITTPGRFFGPSEQEYRDLYKRIYGTEPTDIPKGADVTPAQGGRIKVRRRNPQTGQMEQGTIPASQREQAIQAGYEILP